MKSGGRPDAIAAVRSWYVANAADIHAYASRRVGHDLAEDVVADTFRHAIESFDGFDVDRSNERAWLFGIATNLLRRHWRTEQRRRTALERTVVAEQVDRTPPDAMSRSIGRVDASVDAADVLAAVARLSQDDHELLVLTAWEGLSSSEVAEVLDIPAGTVRSRLHRIRQELDTARRRTNDEPKEAR